MGSNPTPSATRGPPDAGAGRAKDLDADRLDDIASTLLRYIDLPVTAAHRGGGATFTTGFGGDKRMHLPGSGIPHLSLGFTVPPTCETGTPLTLRLVWHAFSTSGAVVLAPNHLSVTRPGRAAIVGLHRNSAVPRTPARPTS